MKGSLSIAELKAMDLLAFSALNDSCLRLAADEDIKTAGMMRMAQGGDQKQWTSFIQSLEYTPVRTTEDRDKRAKRDTKLFLARHGSQVK